jgi:hypothetical protein
VAYMKVNTDNCLENLTKLHSVYLTILRDYEYIPLGYKRKVLQLSKQVTYFQRAVSFQEPSTAFSILNSFPTAAMEIVVLQ